MDGENASPCESASRWTPPSDEGLRWSTGLRVHNSLVDGPPVPFIPASKGKHVTWYICGPTVYDSSHVGHARTYLTFDIVRRIMEDYFGYDIFYVMNVTDIDDKIIIRARRNHLLDAYRQKNLPYSQVKQDVLQALNDAAAKQQAVVAARAQELAAATSVRQQDDLNTAVMQETYKLSQFQDAVKRAEEDRRLENGNSTSHISDADALLQIGGDALAAVLDAREGSSLTDAAIFRAHAMKFEAEFFADMAALGVQPPTVVSRVSEYMDEIVSYVAQIVKKGLAYEHEGSVYFDTTAFRRNGHTYGKLCPHAVGSVALAEEGERDFANSAKKHPSDFALWKASRPGEPIWDSPWGKGRPGWHIECSAMASVMVGERIDVHGGGIDLRFPHHDNELAQAEAYYGSNQWIDYFMHAGHLHIEGHKMSKSLKNFVTIKEALQEYTARQLRLLFVLSYWDKPINYGPAFMADALSKDKYLRNFFQNVDVAIRAVGSEVHAAQGWRDAEKSLHKALAAAQEEVHARLCDNFDTPGAMTAVFEIVKQTNNYVAGNEGSARIPLLRSVVAFVKRILQVFGIDDEAGAQHSAASVAPFIDAFAAFRDTVRLAARADAPKQAILAACDRVRDETMVELGVQLEDRGDSPSVWKLEDPALLKKERDDKLRQAAQAQLKKIENKIQILVKDIARWSKAAAAPDEALRASNLYKDYDEAGLPSTDVEGKPLSSKARKAAEKEAKKLADEHAKFKEKPADYLQSLQQELTVLEQARAKLL
eukprot:jgi/Chlat1/3369/Chrsp23S03805